MRRGSAPVGLVACVVTLCFAAPVAGQRFEPFPRAPGVRFPAELARRAAASMPILTDEGGGAGAAAQTSGAIRILALPALFEDSPEPTVTPAQIDALLFDTTGRTLTTFYDEMSRGQLQVTGTVPDWVRTDVTLLQAAGSVDGHGWIGDGANAHFVAALQAADSTIDFTQFDNDGPDGVPDSGDDDGVVDAITFKFTEVAGSCGGPGFWPHSSVLQGPQGQIGVETQDTGHSGRPIRVTRYTTESVVECDGETPQGPATMAHEFGHALGLPDFYRAVDGIEATERAWLVGCFGLMAAGSWGCGDDVRVWGFGPTGLSPLSRIMLGWAEVISVDDVADTTFTLDPVQESGQVLKIHVSDNGAEYYLMEYRPQIGFDDQIPAGGVMLYYVNEANDIYGGAYSTNPFPYWLVEADGGAQLRQVIPDGGDRGVAGDVFARDGAMDSITPITWPHTESHSGSANVWIHAMSVADGQATIRLTTHTTLTGVPVSAPTFVRALSELTVRFRIEGGTPPYTTALPEGYDLPPGLELAIDSTGLVIQGVPLLGGHNVTLPFYVKDSAGEQWFQALVVELGDALLTDDEILAPILDPTNENADIRAYLDNSGNANGSYDVGDLRAYLQRGGGS